MASHMNEMPLTEAPESLPTDYLADISFDEMGLSPELKRAVTERGYTNPTPVQARAWKPVIEGRDLIVRSKTGTGKTAAFGLPILERIPVGARGVKALVMCPTRELALQVAQEIESLAKYRDVAVCAIYGGAAMKAQEDALRNGAAIIVGTPGRVHDHIRRGNLKLEGCVHAVLDEADEMLNQGFYEEVTAILDCLPKGRQVLLFSATVPEDIQRLIARYTTNAETLLLSGDVYTVDHINHVRYEVSDAYPKPRNLLYVLEMEDPQNAIVFCNTRTDTELVTAVLNRNGFDAELLNGDMAQKDRERVMGKIKRGEVAFMVATDLAARGIDISDLGHVINYSLPEDPAVYLHRVGRTGRIGKSGTAINLTSGRELATLSALEKKYGIKFEVREMPTAEKASAMWAERHVKELKEGAKSSIYEGYLGLAKELKTRADSDELIAFMLRNFFVHQRMERAAGGGHHEAASEAPRSEAPRRDSHERGGRGDKRRDERPRREGRDSRGGREDRPRRDRSFEGDTEPTGVPAVAAAAEPRRSDR
jgi:ATP-dependent RNA helicase DeaD